jgi:hypothetical protein
MSDVSSGDPLFPGKVVGRAAGVAANIKLGIFLSTTSPTEHSYAVDEDTELSMIVTERCYSHLKKWPRRGSST